MEIFTLIQNAVSQSLLFLYQTSGNLGVAILLLTLFVRVLLAPLSVNALKSQKKMKDLQPELDKLKKKHKNDKAQMQKAQMELYKKYNINPLSGCLPYIVQIGLLILLYRVLLNFIGQTEIDGVVINSQFLWLDLKHPDQFYILPILAGVTQLFLSLMIAPGAEHRDIVPNQSKSKQTQQENKKEENVAEMAQTMQKQMLFFMPVMTVFIAMRFPSGLALYWVATTVFSVVQQYFVSGFGGVLSYVSLARQKIIQISTR